MEVTTVQLNKKLVGQMKEIKEYPRQTYNELIANMIKIVKNLKMRNQYDEFLHKIQQPKMKELWDNEKDDEWENA